MSIILVFTVAILLAIFYLFFIILLNPKIKMINLKKKYGDKIQVVHHYGAGMLVEYRKCLKQNNDSISFLRKMAVENQSKIQAIAFNIGAKVGFSFVDPHHIKLVHQNHEAFQKIDISQAIVYLFSNSLLFATGKIWQRQRQFLGKSFHFDEIRNYLPSIKEVCIKNSNLISEDIKKTSYEIQIVKICERVTSEVSFNVFFGSSSQNLTIKQNDGSKIHVANELVSIIMDSFRILQNNKLLFIKSLILKEKSLFVFPMKEEKELLNRLINLKETCQQVVRARKEELIKDPTLYKKNFLDLYLKEIIINNNQDITFEEIVDNFLALFFAGTDTTGNMAGVALYYLSQNRQIQEKAREEILQVLSPKTKSTNTDDLFNELSFEDLSNLNLVNSILKESLRLIPPAIGVFPRYANRDIQIGEFEVKKGDLVNTHFIYNQVNPEVYKDENQFNPYRWMEEKDKQHQNIFNFTPFSLGPRNCIGQHLAMIEGKCILANILLNYNILPIEQQQAKLEMKFIYGIQNDNLVHFSKRVQ